MKVLVVNDHFHTVGGAESYSLGLCRELAKNGHEVESVCSRNGRSGEDVPWRNHYVEPYAIDINYGFSKLWNVESEKKIRDVVSEEKPDVVHFQSVFSRLSTAAVRGAAGKLPTVMTVHDYRFDCSQSKLDNTLSPCPHTTTYGLGCLAKGCAPPWMFVYQSIRNAFARINLKRLDLVVAPSTFMKKALDEALNLNVHYIPHGIDLRQYDYTKPPGKKKLLFVGRLVIDKGLTYLIDAMKEVVESHKDAELTVVGDGPQADKIRKKAMDIKQVKFTGKIPIADVRKYYRECDIVCMPSIWQDNSPMVTYESMACGRPLVASNVGGIPDFVLEGKTGHLVEPKDPHTLAERLNTLLEDPSKTARMGKAARERAESEFSIQKHIQNILRVYDEAGKKFTQVDQR